MVILISQKMGARSNESSCPSNLATYDIAYVSGGEAGWKQIVRLLRIQRTPPRHEFTEIAHRTGKMSNLGSRDSGTARLRLQLPVARHVRGVLHKYQALRLWYQEALRIYFLNDRQGYWYLLIYSPGSFGVFHIPVFSLWLIVVGLQEPWFLNTKMPEDSRSPVCAPAHRGNSRNYRRTQHYSVRDGQLVVRMARMCIRVGCRVRHSSWGLLSQSCPPKGPGRLSFELGCRAYHIWRTGWGCNTPRFSSQRVHFDAEK